MTFKKIPITEKTNPFNNCDCDACTYKETNIVNIFDVCKESIYMWDWVKNHGINPYLLPYGCNDFVHWKCEKGHSFQRTINDFYHNTRCPICIKNILKETSMFEMCPEAEKMWDWNKNVGIDPYKFSWKNTRVLVWWKCENGHSFQKLIKDFCFNPCCKECNKFLGKKLLFDICPQAKIMWDWDKNTGIDPHTITHGQTILVWWKCENGHSFQKQVDYFVKSPTCRKCSINSRRTRLVDYAPNSIKYWDKEKNDIDLFSLSKSSKETAWWKCENGHSFQQRVDGFANLNCCKYCKKKKKRKYDYGTLLIDIYPEILEMIDPKSNVDIYSITYGSGTKLSLYCKNGHHIYLSAYELSSNFHCTMCDKMIPKEQQLFNVYKEAKEMWDYELNEGINPETISYKNSKNYHFRCPNGHSFKRTAKNFRKWKSCPKCFKIVPLNKRLSFKCPISIKMYDKTENDNRELDTVSFGSADDIYFKCLDMGHIFRRKAHEFYRNQTCPYCDNTYVPYEKKLFVVCPTAKTYWNDSKDPDKISFGSSYEANMKCPKGHTFSIKVSSFVRTPRCTVCLKLFLKKEYPTIYKKLDIEANIAAGIDIEKITVGSNDSAFFFCEKCKRIYKLRIGKAIELFNRNLEMCKKCGGHNINRIHFY